jgi:hypothetical protein
MYAAWLAMLKVLVPHGRTHRLSVVVAGMLQHAAEVAYRGTRGRPSQGSVAASLIAASEMADPEESQTTLAMCSTACFVTRRCRRVGSMPAGSRTALSTVLFRSSSHGRTCPGNSGLVPIRCVSPGPGPTGRCTRRAPWVAKQDLRGRRSALAGEPPGRSADVGRRSVWSPCDGS